MGKLKNLLGTLSIYQYRLLKEVIPTSHDNLEKLAYSFSLYSSIETIETRDSRKLFYMLLLWAQKCESDPFSLHPPSFN
jgi:hypothetical protein